MMENCITSDVVTSEKSWDAEPDNVQLKVDNGVSLLSPEVRIACLLTANRNISGTDYVKKHPNLKYVTFS